jgi:DNA-binding beta-propeller fold protein YncE
VSIIDGQANDVLQTLQVGSGPQGVGFNPATLTAYVANGGSNSVSVITAFVGTAGAANCHGKSVSALAKQFRGLDAAAAALGFSSVQDLQATITAYCGQ